ncbi:Ion channel [Trichostrongylus colubriformis]|uniref:Ion channel n=1 Tax=Trichostrongylus colubriformis TaxID=6319 RepID=A0AAN8FMX8_TRICO
MLTNIYANIVIRWRKFRSKKDVENGEVFTLPVVLCMFFMLVYLMGTTTFIFIYDSFSGPPGTGMNYFLSFYFSFISISTIGLGDVMPNNVTFDPIIAMLFFFGMPLMKVVNSSTYQSVEKATIGFLTLLENRLSSTCQGSQVADMDEPITKHRTITLTETNAPPFLDESRNDMTIQSIVTFIKSNAHVYGHNFGRVNLTARKETV